MLNTTDWEAFEFFLRFKRGLSDRTIAQHKRTFKRLEHLVVNWSQQNLQAFLLENRGRLKNSSLNDYRKFFRLLDSWKNTDVSSILSRLPEQETDFDVLTKNEMIDLINCTGHQKYKRAGHKDEKIYSAFYALMAETALRTQEGLRLTWDDWKGDILRVENTKKYRVDELILSEKLQLLLSSLSRTDDRIFPVTEQAVNLNLKKRCEHLGIRKRVSVYTFRRTFATLGVESGIQRDYIQERMRHRSSTSLDKYVRKCKAHQREVLRRHPITNEWVSREQIISEYRNRMIELVEQIKMSKLEKNEINDIKAIMALLD